MNADAKFDPPFSRQAGISLDHAVLDFNRTANSVDHAAELDDEPISHAFHDASVVYRYSRIDQVAAERPQPRQRAILVCTSKTAITDNIGSKEGGEAALNA